MTQTVWQAATRERLVQLASVDPEVRSRLPIPELRDRLAPDLPLAQIVDTIMEAYGPRAAVAERAEAQVPGQDGPWTTMTYRDLWASARALATAWADDPAGPRPGDLLCTVGVASVRYAIVELACIAAGVVSVPLPLGGSVRDRSAMISELRPAAVYADATQLDAITESIVGADVQVKHLGVLNGMADTGRRWPTGPGGEPAADGHAKHVDQLTDAGRGLPFAPLAAPLPDALAQIIYTSGTSGSPNGAMFTERHLAGLWLTQAQSSMPAIVVHYMPMSHTAGRMVLTGALARGGVCFFSSGSDPARLWRDVAQVRPTEFFFIPRLCEMVRDRYKASHRRFTETDAEVGVRARALVRDEILGGRVLSAVNGSAPLDSELKSLMDEILGVPLHDAYGSTEAGGIVLFDNRIQRPPVLDYKLEDVPDLGYYSTDRPHPRGELLLKTTSMVPGYYKRPQATRDMFDEEGFYRSGDVMAQTGPDTLVFVGRRNDTLKLSQAEFVAVRALEALYTTSPSIDQVFIYGRSGRADLLAVVVPSEELRAEADQSAQRGAIARSLREVAREHDLQPFEIPRDFLIETTPFGAHNGLATGLNKLVRPRLVERYALDLEALYKKLDADHGADLLRLRSLAGDRPALDTLLEAAGALLAGHDHLDPDATFGELGGDSMSAFELSSRLSEIFGIELSSTLILGSGATLRKLAHHIALQLDPERQQVSARTVHAARHHLNASELRLGAFMDVDALQPGSGDDAADRVVVLTGANGFLGRFLALEQLRKPGGHLVCLVRGADDVAARARLDASFASDPALAREWSALAAGRLDVLAADMSQPGLGLAAETWDRLARQATEVVHAAAAVNHVLPYAELFGPNVLGTSEVIRLAVTHHLKPITYVSTVGIADQVSAPLDEDADIRDLCPARDVADTYANGYANTKWASEVLLREAHDAFGLPVAVFRSNFQLAHRRYAGQVNAPDLLTRLLLSIALTGLAPETFFPGQAPSSPSTHFDALPVDYIAGAICQIGAGDGPYHTYNLSNPPRRAVTSLDDFVQWMSGCGVTVHRIDDYDQWVSRMEISLRALPPVLQQKSLLPILDAFRHPEQLPVIVPPSDRFREAVQAEGLESGRLPAITADLVGKYVDDLRCLGLLGEAAPSAGPPDRPYA